jgi:hypothetical protein
MWVDRPSQLLSAQVQTSILTTHVIDQVFAISGLLDPADIAHVGAWDELDRIPEEGIQGFGGPNNFGCLERGRIPLELRHTARSTAKESFELGPSPIAGYRVASHALCGEKVLCAQRGIGRFGIGEARAQENDR